MVSNVSLYVFEVDISEVVGVSDFVPELGDLLQLFVLLAD